MSVAACGGSDDDGSTEGLPQTVTLDTVMDLSGPAGLAGNSVRDGFQFAIDEINETDFLDGTELELRAEDTQTNREQAVSLVTQAAKGDSPVIFGPVASSVTLAVAPIAQREGVPYVATQSHTAGVVEIGDYIFRLTPPQSTYQDKMAKYLKSKDVGTVGLIYLEEGASNAEWGRKLMPQELEDEGIDVVESGSVMSSEGDFASLATRLIKKHPDAIGISVSGTQNSTIVGQLRQQGYDGLIFGDLGFAGGTLEGAGAAADGVVYTTNFSADLETASSKKFIDAWTKTHDGKEPSNFNAEGYDAMWFVARAIKEAGSVDRDEVRDAMESVAKGGLEGAQGQLAFDGRDARTDGLIVEWRDGGVHQVS